MCTHMYGWMHNILTYDVYAYNINIMVKHSAQNVGQRTRLCVYLAHVHAYGNVCVDEWVLYVVHTRF